MRRRARLGAASSDDGQIYYFVGSSLIPLLQVMGNTLSSGVRD
jgi:hypothetical protein